MAKVIDALVVTLGLDPSGYKQGAATASAAQASLKQTAQAGASATQQATQSAGKAQNALAKQKKKEASEERKRQKQREREQREADSAEAKRSQATIDRLKGIGAAAAGLVLGFNTVKGALEAYLGASNQLANLGRIAPTIGTDVKTLDTLGDAYKQVGGKAEEAGADIAKLAQAQFSFAINAPDATAGWLRKLGVGLFDPNTGAARDKVKIQEDIAAALKAQTGDLQVQAAYARQIGLSESFIQLYLVKNGTERAKILKDAEATAKATEAATKGAQAQSQAISRVGNQIKGVWENLVAVASPGVANVLTSVSDALDAAKPFKGHFTPGSPTPFRAKLAAAEKANGLPSNILLGIAHRESSFDPNAQAVNPKTGKVTGQGLMQLNPKFFPNAGESTDADINTAAKLLAQLYKKYRKSYPQSQARTLALQAYNAGPKNVDAVLAGKDPYHNGGKLSAETLAYAPAVDKYAGYAAGATTPTTGSGGSTTVNSTHIESITVHTAATDARGIAASIRPALTQPGSVVQANSGMN